MNLTHQQVKATAGDTTLRLQADPSWSVGQFSDLVREAAEAHWGKGCTYTYTRGSDHDGVDICLVARS